MLRLPKATEANRQIAKSAVFSVLALTPADRARFDADISRVFLTNELSAQKINVRDGKDVEFIYVLSLVLKRRDFDEKGLITFSRLLGQNAVLVPLFEGEGKIAVSRNGKLLRTGWRPSEDLSLKLRGYDLDEVWENIIKDIEGGEWKEELSLDENLALHERQAKLKKEIDRLEKQASREKQPKKKFELVQKIKQLKYELRKV